MDTHLAFSQIDKCAKSRKTQPTSPYYWIWVSLVRIIKASCNPITEAPCSHMRSHKGYTPALTWGTAVHLSYFHSVLWRENIKDNNSKPVFLQKVPMKPNKTIKGRRVILGSLKTQGSHISLPLTTPLTLRRCHVPNLTPFKRYSHHPGKYHKWWISVCPNSVTLTD